MKKIFMLLLLSIVSIPLIIGGCSPLNEQEKTLEQNTANNKMVADGFVQALGKGDHKTSYSLLDEEMKKVLKSEEAVEQMWSALQNQTGLYQSHAEPQLISLQEGMDTYNYPATFQNGRYMIQVTLKNNLVAGFYVLPNLEKAEQYVTLLLAGDYETVFAMSDTALQEAYISEEGLETTWQSIIAQTGAYISRETPYATQQNEMVIYTFPAEFQNGPYLMQVTVNKDGLVAGFFIQPELSNENNVNALAKKEGPKPSTDLPAGVLEKDIVINQGGQHELYGKLTYPAEINGAIPAAILVHGSGAHDMDETINENKPFKDIAYTLSSQGVAAFRYNKVTLAYPQDFDNATITIDMETVTDAVAAKEALIEQSSLEFSKIYVVGHSLGGMMAPKIASLGNYDGMILLAGSTRSLVDIAYDQTKILLPRSGASPELLAKSLAEYDKLYREAQEIMKLPLEEQEGKLVFHFPALYVHSIQNPPAEQYIKELDLPMLILQGDKDFQVYSDKDFTLYSEITKGLRDVTMKEYKGLNHLFMPSFMEQPDVSEYQKQSKVDQQVLQDMAQWILARSK